MRKYIILSVFVVVSCVIALRSTVYAVGNHEEKVYIEKLVDVLGYDGAIHDFKDYILWGDQAHRDAAEKKFKEALVDIKHLKTTTDDPTHLKALDDLEKVMNEYLADFPKIAKLWAEGKSIHEIDMATIVNDKPGIEGLGVLIDAYHWSELEELEHLIGYGKGIHHYKNYVLRGDERFFQASYDELNNAIAYCDKMISHPKNEKAKKDIEIVKATLEEYKKNLFIVKDMWAQGKKPEEIEKVVIIKEKGAKAALIDAHKYFPHAEGAD